MGIVNTLMLGKGGYDADALLYFAQLTGTVSSTWKDYVNKYIKQLKADGNWTADRLWLHATENQQNARISLRNPSSTALTEVNSPTWTSGQGYTGNGSNMYLNTNYNAALGGSYALNSAAYGVYCRTNNDGGKIEIGSFNGATVFTEIDIREGNVLYTCINGVTFQSFANADSRGLFANTRSTNLATKTWKNGSAVVTAAADSSVDVPSCNTYLLARSDNGVATTFSNRQISLTFIGDNSMNQATFYTATQTLMTDLGIQV